MRVASLFVALVAMLPTPLFSQSAHHEFHKDFYSAWREPTNPEASCCNARIEKDGVEKGDCEPTQARVKNGRWEFYIRQTGQWVTAFDNVIVRNANPNIVDGHICWTPGRGVICAKPPDIGG